MTLVNCDECGNQISEKAESCPKCGAPGPGAMQRSKEHPYLHYHEVPSWRKSSVNSWFILINLLSMGLIPLVIITCIALLSGDIYYKKKDEHGYLLTWSFGNKIVAAIILLIDLILITGRIIYELTRQ